MILGNTNLTTLIITSVVILIILCLIIPNIILPYVKHHHSHPKEGIENLNFGDKFMNLMFFMSKAPLLVCLLFSVMFVVSILLASMIKIRPSTIKSL